MKKLTVIITFCAILLSSCTHYYYVANVQNVPLLKEKNELHLSGSYGTGDESSCLEAQAAYAVSDKFGVMANFMSVTAGNVSKKNYGEGNFFEGAVGYYKTTGKHGVYEIYGGVGTSYQHHEYTELYYDVYNGYSDLSFMKLFLQPSFGLTYNWLDITLSGRLCSLIYTKIDNHIGSSSYQYENLSALQRKAHFNFEPALTIRTGWKYLKVQAQVQYAGLINRPDEWFAEDWHFSIGLNIALAKRFK